ncbi:MAG TPA: GTP cyclohydrolase I FolE [Actinomycetes bacterium]
MSEDGRRQVAEIGSLAEESQSLGAGRPAFDFDKVEQGVRMILEGIGEDLDRDGLRETPTRVARMWEEITVGLRTNPADALQVVFEESHDEMVMVRDIPLYSICEHHMAPFIGKAHVAYIPNVRGQLTGLSKLARLVDGLARRLQVQERLTAQIADQLVEHLEPRGALVVIEAEHLCMSMRGVRKPGAVTVTSAVRGQFRDSMSTRMEAMNLIGVTRLA